MWCRSRDGDYDDDAVEVIVSYAALIGLCWYFCVWILGAGVCVGGGFFFTEYTGTHLSSMLKY